LGNAGVVSRLVFGLGIGVLAGAEFPEAEISNGSIRAKLYLPDPEQGYYRATRFDWSGVIASLEYRGHNYFESRQDRHDPRTDDSISGPVEDFRTNNGGLGYDEAKAGDTFVKIGVGILRKPDEPRYRQAYYYELVDSGKWSVRNGADWIGFDHELTDGKGYAYVYRKTVRLVRGKPEMVLEHSLRNTGREPIETDVYDHNFFVIDRQPSGPDFIVKVPFELKATRDLKGIAEVRGMQIAYLRQMGKGESIITNLSGFGDSARDYDITVENRKVSAGVRITADRPLSALVFWSDFWYERATLCPEPYIRMRIEPGQESTWHINYEFYTLPQQK
jgi:hypothetical protein